MHGMHGLAWHDGGAWHDGSVWERTHLILQSFFLPLSEVVELAAIKADLVSGQQPGQAVKLLQRGGVDGGVDLQQGMQ